ncbi:MAG: hypothetical protein A2033_13470 [Bacteroidetes bacterium GWA2_31_9]|nr:MAG: hypothetical protein A2033_13470 [Bacteroidetes bacterium GWA2_31_9]
MLKLLLFSFLTSFAITYIAIPSIIYVAKVKNLFDEPGARKSHSTSVPTLGGLAIFAGLIFSVSFWTDFSKLWQLQYILAALIVIFGIGIKDDIVTLSPRKKAIGQLISAIIITVWGKIRISSFSGIFGIYEIPEYMSIIFSIFVILVIINAVNLIDGINGLSASLTAIACIAFGTWFYYTDETKQLSIVSFALLGSLVAFLRFNITPSKIFMGDTGSMLLGLMLSILAIKMIDINEHLTTDFKLFSGPAIVIGILIVPLFDMLRVFTIRILRKRSPFHADKNHIHHILLKLNLSHSQSTILLSMISIFFVIFSFLMDWLGNYYLIVLISLLAFIFSNSLVYIYRKQKSNKD